MLEVFNPTILHPTLRYLKADHLGLIVRWLYLLALKLHYLHKLLEKPLWRILDFEHFIFLVWFLLFLQEFQGTLNIHLIKKFFNLHIPLVSSYLSCLLTAMHLSLSP